MNHDDHQAPHGIVNHQASGVLELQWFDGRTSRLPHWLLRTRCRCGACQQQLRRDGTAPAAPYSLRLTDMLPMSDRALNLVFSDGHDRGIYPWAYLHELTQQLEIGAAPPLPLSPHP